MPVPNSLTTAPHRDVVLALVSGTWPADVGGEVVFSSPQASGRASVPEELRAAIHAVAPECDEPW